jgi:sirohydrochlorin cobaltochelatase
VFQAESMDALILLGHGSTQNTDAGAAVRLHAAGLRERRLFAEVREAFWKQEPHVKTVLTAISADRIFIVPLFISEGYFSSDVIPRELGFDSENKLKLGNSEVFYCRPVGTHRNMSAVLLGRAADIVVRFPFPRAPRHEDTTLFIAGHGTTRNDNSRAAIEEQVKRIAATGHYAAVHGIFLEEPPRIAECYQLAKTENIVIVPFFISDGMHSRQDIPVLLGEPESRVQQQLAIGRPTWHNPTERKGKLVWYAPAAGTDPRVADIIVERVREAASQHPS